MGNCVTKVSHCFARAGDISARHHDISIDNYGREGLGHSFCYIRPYIHPASRLCSNSNSSSSSSSSSSNNKIHSELEKTTFRSISGASLSANTSTTSSTSLNDTLCSNSSGLDRASTFESSDSFASLPLQPVPRGSGVLSSSGYSGPIERGFLSGPIERGFLSGPIDPASFYSGPFDKEKDKDISSVNYSTTNQLQSSSLSHAALITSIDEVEVKPKKQQAGLIKTLKRAISNTISRGQKLMVAPIRVKESTSTRNVKVINQVVVVDDDTGHEDLASEFSIGSQNLQWAQGKAGEDRVHVVISEEHGWIFVGIYDGFNGPDAPDYLLSYLYTNIDKELKELLWNNNDNVESTATKAEGVLHLIDQENSPLGGNYYDDLKRKHGKNLKRTTKGGDTKRWEEKLNLKLKEKMNCYSNGVNHYDVLRALSQALRKTEEAYFESADRMATDNPELALMGSCVLVMLMKGEDVYLMNVGDSRAVLAQRGITVPGLRKGIQDLEIINEESKRDRIEDFDGDELCRLRNLNSIQLTMDHTTYVDKEVERIKKEHPEDVSAVMNDRVKGYLKVTRAFGVGFLKQPKWNDILLEMFRIDYIGTSPYVTCTPSLYHHRLSPKDRFLILSSDGLYQYFTNQEAVLEVGSFIAAFPEGDPAQHLIEEVLFRAARNAGMDFHELLEIPQGERRRYHDDVSVIIISLEGRIWRSSV